MISYPGFLFKENVRYPLWICRDTDSRDLISSDFRNPMIIFSDSSDPI